VSRLSARILVVVEFLITLAILPPALYAVQNPHALHLISVKNQATKKPQAAEAVPVIAPPGSVVHEARRGDSLPSVARQYLKKTSYLTSSELSEAIRQANSNHTGTFFIPASS